MLILKPFAFAKGFITYDICAVCTKNRKKSRNFSELKQNEKIFIFLLDKKVIKKYNIFI